MFVNIKWKASLHLLGQGSELVSFNSAPGCVASMAYDCSCGAWRECSWRYLQQEGDPAPWAPQFYHVADGYGFIRKKTIEVNVRKIQDFVSKQLFVLA